MLEHTIPCVRKLIFKIEKFLNYRVYLRIMKKVSVIIPYFNNLKYIFYSIDSIYQQKYKI